MIKASPQEIQQRVCHPVNRLLGTLPYYLLPVKRDIIKKNISLVFEKSLDDRQVTRFTKAVYGNLIRLGAEVMKNGFLTKKMRCEELEIRNFKVMEEALELGKGVLWLSCHLGNWEVGLVNLMDKKKELQGKTTVIRKHLKPEWLHQMVMGRFHKAGIDVLTPQWSSMKTVLKKLKKNEVVLFVLDQHASTESGTRTQFFGHEVQISKGLARIAVQTGSPVVPIFTWKERGRHVCYFGDPIPLAEGENKEEVIQKTTQLYSLALEQAITHHPEQWFGWFHKLWKVSTSYC